MKKLLLTGAIKLSEEYLQQLKALGFEIIFVKDERVSLQMDVSNIDAVVCNSLFLYNDITKFKKLQFIQLTSAGFERVPLDYIKKRGIKIFNAKGVYSIPIAEWVILKILEIYKKSRYFFKAQCEHKWEKQRDLLELTDKVATIVGFGDIGSEVAKRLKVFGAKIIGVGRRKIDSDLIDEYCSVDDLDNSLRKSDIVVLTVPLTSKTYHLINAARLANMKDNSVLINVSRGSVIDEDALVKALQKEKFLGVALDVFEEEPLATNSPLWDIENVIITPHNSFLSDKTSNRLSGLIVGNLKKFGGETSGGFGR